VDGDVVSVERVIPATPEAIFDLIADASRHPDIDGSGTVKQVKAGGPARLSAGATFGMSMHMGVRYSMVNTVVEFEDNRRIAWKAAPGGLVGRFAGGRIWRYELEPVEGPPTGVPEDGRDGQQDPIQHGSDPGPHRAAHRARLVLTAPIRPGPTAEGRTRTSPALYRAW
jgi:uncharacterized protein YndB with AHSA1/START domain